MFGQAKKKQSPLEGDCIFQSFQSSPTLLLQKLCMMAKCKSSREIHIADGVMEILSRSIHSKAEFLDIAGAMPPLRRPQFKKRSDLFPCVLVGGPTKPL